MSHDDLERRLGSALRSGLAADVDLGPVLRGAAVRAGRMRRRRVVVACAAAALAVAVPAAAVGWTTLGPDRPAAVDVATVPEGSDAQPEPAPRPEPEPEPQPGPEPAGLPAPAVDPSTLDPAESAYEIPQSALLQPADLPEPVVELGRSTYRDIPTVPGQSCGGTGPEPAAALSQQLAEQVGNDFDQLAVSLQVTGWSRGDGDAAFAAAGSGGGRCRWLDEVQPVPATSAAGRPELTLTRTNGGLRFWAAAVQVTDLVVAVEVSGPVDGGPDRAELALELARTAADRLVAAGAVGSTR